MRIGIIGPIWLPIPPKGNGGSEIVVYNLVEGLADLGHEVVLFASGGSKTRAELRSILPRPLYDIKGKFDFSDPSYDLLNTSSALAASKEFDVLHNMVGFQALPFSPFAGCPMVHTSHSSLKEYDALVSHFKDQNYVSISNAQRQFHPDANYVATVYHGIDTNLYTPNTEKEDFFVFLSEIWEKKAPHLAIEAVKKTGDKLVIAGFIDARGQQYFNQYVKPHIDDKQIKYVGPADEQMKIDLFQRAKGFLFPTQWNEAFGLVMIEALACGTPVIGWRSGAVPEVIEHGKTGFVVDSTDAMAQAAGSISSISPEACRQSAVEKFSRPVMATNYEAVYKKISA